MSKFSPEGGGGVKLNFFVDKFWQNVHEFWPNLHDQSQEKIETIEIVVSLDEIPLEIFSIPYDF